MVLLLGVVLPDHKPLRIALTTFYGIGYYTSSRIMASLSIHKTATVGSLTEEQLVALSHKLGTFVLENDLRRRMQGNIMHYKTIGSYIGRRHSMGYPVHGQRTRTNAKTARKLNRIDRRQFCTSSFCQEKMHFKNITKNSWVNIQRILIPWKRFWTIGFFSFCFKKSSFLNKTIYK